jgi:two-component system chemotaxis sensor kinase CheA
VAARRAGAPPPDVSASLAALTHVARAEAEAAHAVPASELAAPIPAHAGESASASSVLYHVEFVPSVELTARGIGVDVVRARLRDLGELVDAKPRVIPGGVAFDFTVAVAPGHAPDERWRADGMRWTAPVKTPLASTVTIADALSDLADALVDLADVSLAPPSFGGVTEVTRDAAPAPPTPAAGAPGSSTVRVDLARLNGVMRLVGDLVITRARLDEMLKQSSTSDPAALHEGLEETNAVLERQLRRLRESVMRIRLVPVGEVFERLRFAARDAIRESGKQVRLVFDGQSTEIDKLVVDRMLEPLLHLVRNAVGHGIERPEEREALGKPPEGTLTLRAAAAGDRITIDVEDDGAGVDMAAVTAHARARGLLAQDEPLASEHLLDLLCAPGFSTRTAVDLTSGRGIGMDVVRSTVRALAGELSLITTPGRGTRFVIELPLTLMILDALLVDIGGQQMAVPQPALREILQIERASIVQFENNDVIAYRDGMLPLVRVSRLFRLPATRSATTYVLVVGIESSPVGLLVDRLIGLREIVVHPVADPLVAMPGIAGATELGDGTVSLILDAAAVLRLAQEQRDATRSRTRASSAGSSALARGASHIATRPRAVG